MRFYDHRRINYGNVIFDRTMESDRAAVLAYAAEHGVARCGRFGKWDYLWTGQSLVRGYQALAGKL